MVKVDIHGKTVGFLSEDDNYVEFQYSEEMLNSGIELAPLLIPLQEGIAFRAPKNSRDSFQGLPHFISDALPDQFGNKLIEAHYAKKGISAAGVSQLDRLAYVGTKAMGALEFQPMTSETKERQALLEIKQLMKDARSAIEGRIDDVSADFIRIGSTAGGARPKALIAMHPENKTLVAGNEVVPKGYEHYLLKFDGLEQQTPIDANALSIEYAYYRMAKSCGIDIMPSKQLHEGKASHFMTARFDRNGNKKIHSQTLCGMGGFDFNMRNTFSYSDYFSVVNNLNLDDSQKMEAFKRMVFNVAGVNHDDHTKNFSFLMDDDGRWSLSPAYDLSYNHGNKWTKEHFLLINGKDSDITYQDLILESNLLGLSEQERSKAITDITEVFLDGWESHALASGVSDGVMLDIKDDIFQNSKTLTPPGGFDNESK